MLIHCQSLYYVPVTNMLTLLPGATVLVGREHTGTFDMARIRATNGNYGDQIVPP